MTEQVVANIITFWMAVLLGVVAFVAGWFWGYASAERAYNAKDSKRK
jgi:uncharacterized protein YneF (UPF0154 family)